MVRRTFDFCCLTPPVILIKYSEGSNAEIEYVLRVGHVLNNAFNVLHSS